MSQYPSPYSPYTPPGPQDYAYAQPGAADLLAPAKRAGVMMIVLGSLALTCGMCVLGAAGLPFDELPPEQKDLFRELEQQAGMPAKQMLTIYGAGTLVGGGLFLGLGIFVRRGGRGIVIASIVLVSATAIWFVKDLVSMAMLGGPAAAMAGGACVSVVQIGLCALLLVWLAQALRAIPHLTAIAQQYQAQYWQYEQQRQAYAYGHGTVPGSAQPQGYAPPQGYAAPQGYAPPPPQQPAQPPQAWPHPQVPPTAAPPPTAPPPPLFPSGPPESPGPTLEPRDRGPGEPPGQA